MRSTGDMDWTSTKKWTAVVSTFVNEMKALHIRAIWKQNSDTNGSTMPRKT